MPKLNITQIQVLFFITGAFMGLVQPLSAGFIGIIMIIIGWKNIFRRVSPTPDGNK